MAFIDLQKMLDAFSDSNRRVRSDYHVTLSRLIATLEGANAALPIEFDTGAHPGDLDSYRGYYSDLSIEPSNNVCTVGELLARCKDALGNTFTGYKGGDFVMGPDTPLWTAEYSHCGRAIVGIVTMPEKILLVTKDTDE